MFFYHAVVAGHELTLAIWWRCKTFLKCAVGWPDHSILHHELLGDEGDTRRGHDPGPSRRLSPADLVCEDGDYGGDRVFSPVRYN